MIHLLKDGGRASIVLPEGSLTGDVFRQRIRQKLLEDCNLHTIVRLPNSVFQPYASVATNLLFCTTGEPTKTYGAGSTNCRKVTKPTRKLSLSNWLNSMALKHGSITVQLAIKLGRWISTPSSRMAITSTLKTRCHYKNLTSVKKRIGLKPC
jgi:type I restriction-modification system DNA methylase subunit